MPRLIVLGVVVLAAAAAVDAIKRQSPERASTQPGPTQPAGRLLGEDPTEYVAGGRRMRTRVLRNGREYLSREALDKAFPVPAEGILDIAHLASAPDGTLAVAIYKFPGTGGIRRGVELWQRGRLMSAFAVPPGSFGNGLAFAADGELVAVLPARDRPPIFFDRLGRRVSGERRIDEFALREYR
jgi:hypothetical protein